MTTRTSFLFTEQQRQLLLKSMIAIKTTLINREKELEAELTRVESSLEMLDDLISELKVVAEISEAEDEQHF